MEEYKIYLLYTFFASPYMLQKYQLECFFQRDIAYKFITTNLVGTMVTEDNGIVLEKALKMDEQQRKKIYTTYAPKPE